MKIARVSSRSSSGSMSPRGKAGNSTCSAFAAVFFDFFFFFFAVDLALLEFTRFRDVAFFLVVFFFFFDSPLLGLGTRMIRLSSSVSSVTVTSSGAKPDTLRMSRTVRLPSMHDSRKSSYGVFGIFVLSAPSAFCGTASGRSIRDVAPDV